MLSSQKFIFFFFALTALLSVGSANPFFFWLRDGKKEAGNGQGAANDVKGVDGAAGAALTSVVDANQGAAQTNQPTGGDSAPNTTSPSSSPTSSPSTTPTSTPSSSPSSTPTSSPSSDTSSTSSSSPSSAAPTSTSTTDSKSQASTTFVVIETATISGGKQTTITHSSVAAATATNGLASDQNSGSSDSGNSAGTKKVAIGVGVGIGGAILLGGLGIVAWRMWGRRRHSVEEDHFLMNETLSEKPPSSAASPFKSTLDQYHNPAGRLNQASNF